MLHILTEAIQSYGITLNPKALEQFRQYYEMLLAKNERMNLTAITAPADAAVKHFADSLLLLAAYAPAAGGSLLDVGSGAGFPGIPLAIARPDLRVTLLEATAKKCDFLKEAVRALGLRTDVVQARAEDAAHNPALRGQFDAVAARAVAALPVLAELCMPFVCQGGVFAALKGPLAQDEIRQAKRAIAILGGGEAAQRLFLLQSPTETLRRTVVLIPKISQSPSEYPRNYGTIRNKTL
ncbi:MAG: 16S rRNA (guanine(527)-N(7))-methyltransferase RsmG [Oscillospiraceae bacterium]|nr:16S rRNA (guanine(527)-N(7))-methyltransferase RsmG [Oscillospiraceae bacterium]